MAFIPGTAGCRTLTAGTCAGIGRHCPAFSTALAAGFNACNAGHAADSAVAAAFTVSCSTGVYDSGLLAFFKVTHTGTDSVYRRDRIAYHDLTDIDAVVSLFLHRLQTDDTVYTAAGDPDIMPVAVLPGHKTAAARFRQTENAWMEQGAPLPEWRTYYQSQEPIAVWAGRHRFNERTATLLGVLPGSSGQLYTRQTTIGVFWTISELALIAYGVTRTDPYQRGAILAALIPLTAVDGIMSRLSARKSNAVTESIEQLYPDRKYPFDFMRDDRVK